MPLARYRGSCVLGAVLSLLLVACGATSTPGRTADEPSTPPADGEGGTALHVIAELAPLADVVGHVVGDRGEVDVLVPPGADSHTFEPRPTDARRLHGADIVFLNGLGLNEPLARLAEANVPDGVPVVRLAETVLADGEVLRDHVHDGDADHTHEGGADHTHDGSEDHTHGDEDGDHEGAGDGAVNPHVWLDVGIVARYVDAIADALAEVDPDHAETYHDNAAAYSTDLETLDRAIAEAIDTIANDDRKLVTYHDSWSYFAHRYGMDVVAAVQPADLSQPSAAEVRRLIDQIEEEDIPAVFGSEVFPSDVLALISEETGARYVADLSDDDLPGEEGDPEHSYVGMMVANARTIVEALGGDPSALERVDPGRRT